MSTMENWSRNILLALVLATFVLWSQWQLTVCIQWLKNVQILVQVLELVSAPKVSALEYFLNNFRLEQVRDLRFSAFDSQDSEAYFCKQNRFCKKLRRWVFKRISEKPRWIFEKCHRSIVIFLHIRNQHQKLHRLMYISSLLMNFFFRRKIHRWVSLGSRHKTKLVKKSLGQWKASLEFVKC